MAGCEHGCLGWKWCFQPGVASQIPITSLLQVLLSHKPGGECDGGMPVPSQVHPAVWEPSL